jgi:hypothetical protein
MSYTEALSRIAQIQQQLAALSGGRTVPSGAGSSAGFAEELARARAASAGVSSAEGAYAGAAPGAQGVMAPAGTGGAEALPQAARAMLTEPQQQFAGRLSALTGLDPGVVSAWLLAEESGEAARSRQAEGNNDWLNIGYTDSATYGASDSVWANPQSAAEATAAWLRGQNSIPGYGTASGGIQAILGTAGQSPEAQIAAIQSSGWASSGYPDLPGLYRQVTG